MRIGHLRHFERHGEYAGANTLREFIETGVAIDVSASQDNASSFIVSTNPRAPREPQECILQFHRWTGGETQYKTDADAEIIRKWSVEYLECL